MTRSSGSGAARARAAVFAFVAVAIGMAIFGCNSTTAPSGPHYLCTSGCALPENALADLQTAFDWRDSAAVGRLLAPGFVFRFEPADIVAGAPDSLDRSDFLGCIGNLFYRGSPTHNPPAVKISLRITAISHDDDNRIGHAGWKKYTVNAALTLTFQDGNQTQANSPAILYLISGNGMGGGWQIAEWQGLGQILRVYQPRIMQPYFPTSSPEGVITDFQNAFINLDVAEFDTLLAPDYVFRFQPSDVYSGAPDSLDRAFALNCLHSMMESGCSGNPPAQKISLTITIVSQSEDNRIGHTGWRRYGVNTALTITFGDGNQTQVNGAATFYFRQEPAGSARWVLAEWRDQPLSTGRPVRRANPGQIAASRITTWGRLFRIYDCAETAIAAAR